MPRPKLPVMSAPKFEPTHVLAYEAEDRMVEVLVVMTGSDLLQADEWAGNAVPDWTFEDDGRLYYCGVDYAAEKGVCSLRIVGKQKLSLDMVLSVVRQGRHSVMDIAEVFGRAPEEIATAIATLERAGKLTFDAVNPDRVAPVFGGGRSAAESVRE